MRSAGSIRSFAWTQFAIGMDIRKEINTGNGKILAYSHTVRIEIPNFTIQDTLIDFMPNLNVPLLGVKSFLSNFTLTVDYPALTFSLQIKNK